MLLQAEIVDYYTFPDSNLADEDGIVCVGGDLSPEMLISAYRQGVFPWFNEEDLLERWRASETAV